MTVVNTRMDNMERAVVLFVLHLSDSERVHTEHGHGHLECLPHHQQQGALRLLRDSPATLPTQSRAHRQLAHLDGHEPAGDDEGPEGK